MKELSYFKVVVNCCECTKPPFYRLELAARFWLLPYLAFKGEKMVFGKKPQ